MNRIPERKVMLEGKFLRLVHRGKWEYVERVNASGIVVIVALTEDNKLLLVEQFRVPVAARVVELPAGLAGDVAGAEGEDLAAAARRELLEETGYEVDRLDPLMTGPVSAGLSTEMITVFLARNARPVGPGGGDETEDIKVHAVPLREVEGWLQKAQERGLLVDAKVYAGLHFAMEAGDCS